MALCFNLRDYWESFTSRYLGTDFTLLSGTRVILDQWENVLLPHNAPRMLWSCWLSGSPVDSHHPHSATEKTSQSFKRYNPRKVFWEGSKKDARDNTHFWFIWRLLNTYWILMVNDVLGVLMRRHRYLPAFSRLEAMPRPSPMKSCWRTKSQLDSFKVLFCIAEFEFCSFGRCSHGETLRS